MLALGSMREKTFNIRLSAEEWARLDSLTEFHGVTAAGLIRMLLKQEERRVAGESRAASDLRSDHVKTKAAAASERPPSKKRRPAKRTTR